MAPLETLARPLDLADAPRAAKPGRATGVQSDLDAAQGRALLASHYTQLLLDAARDIGVDPAALFGDEPVFATRGRRAQWSHEDLGIVSQNLRRATGDELWGLAPGFRVPLGTFRFACDLFPTSASLGEALTRAFRLYGLMGAVKFELRTEGDLASVVFTPPPMPPVYAAFVTEWHLWLLHYFAQWFVRSEIGRVRVDFPHAPQVEPSLYDGTFGSRTRFGMAEARIVFPKQDLARAPARTPEEVDAFFARTGVTLKYAPDVEQSVSTALRIALLGRLQAQSSMPTLEELAQEQGVTGQTLRRRLIAEGKTYRTLKAEVRSLVARQHLARPGATLSEVASRAGFAETSAFTRAFIGWTGMTVSKFRRTYGVDPLPEDRGI
jgi:AraC-like DNA-binding protein